MGTGSDVELCESVAKLEGSDVKIDGSNAEIVAETGPFVPLEIGVSTLSEVVDFPSSSSTRSFGASISAGKGELDVVLLELVTTVV